MTTVELEEELHSNTRRTRITYRGMVDGQPAAIKCYRKPLFGLIHWIRALRRGKKIRQAGGPVPPVIFSGWIWKKRCFGLGMVFLEGYRPLREVLTEESNRDRQIAILRVLAQTMADLHNRGIEQPDGNLTNFLLGPDHDLKVVDEDDIRVFSNELPTKVASSNLANVAARLLDEEMVHILAATYLVHVSPTIRRNWDDGAFVTGVSRCKSLLEKKRIKRNIEPLRTFD